ncbi:hypothetical protein C0J52_27424, partial [Blattella germanica]
VLKINTRSKEYRTIVSAQYSITQVNTTGALVLPISRGHSFTARDLTLADTIADESPVKNPSGSKNEDVESCKILARLFKDEAHTLTYFSVNFKPRRFKMKCLL